MDLNCLPAMRYRVNYRGEKIYLVISFDSDGKPIEVFAEHPIQSDPKFHYMMASWDALTRFVTIALGTVGIAKTIEQLNRASRQKNDLPGIIAGKLEEFK